MPFRVVFGVIDEIEESIGKRSLLEDLRMSELPTLLALCTKLIKLLVSSKPDISLIKYFPSLCVPSWKF